MLKTRRALLIAAVVHAGLLGTLGTLSLQRGAPTAHVSSTAAPTRGAAEEGIAIDLVDPPSEPTPAPVDHEEIATMDSAKAEPRVQHDTPSAEPQLEPALPAAPIGTPPSLTRSLAPASIGIALGTPNAFAPSSAGATLPDEPARAATTPENFGARPKAPTAAQAKENVEASLRQAKSDRDQTVGLGPEGPVLTALHDATMGSTAPVTGRAIFTAIADARGTVESLAVDSCDGSRAAWEDAARIAREALKGRTLRVAGVGLTSWSKPVKMKIQVVSSLEMPSGHDTGVDTKLLGLSVRKGNGKHPTRVAILNPLPHLETQRVNVAPGLVTTVDVVAWDFLTVKGDPVDLGAKPIRVVHTKLVAVEVSAI